METNLLSQCFTGMTVWWKNVYEEPQPTSRLSTFTLFTSMAGQFFLWDVVLCIVGCLHPGLCSLSASNISGLHRCSSENVHRYCHRFLRVQSTSLEKYCMLDPEVDSGIPAEKYWQTRDQWLAEWPWVELSTVFSSRLEKWGLWRRGLPSLVVCRLLWSLCSLCFLIPCLLLVKLQDRRTRGGYLGVVNKNARKLQPHFLVTSYLKFPM